MKWGRGRENTMVRRSSVRQGTLPLALPMVLLKLCLHPSNVQWQVPEFSRTPSHSFPSHQPPPVPGFPPAVMSSFPLGVRTFGFSPTPSRGSCRNKRDLSGNGGFNMALTLRSLGVDCVRNLGPLPTTPPHPHISFCHNFRWKEP